ncbi:MAG: hypothetical protein A2W23_01780 [Planctomycetes bacterium RBG_16_43_13]|nr:MAG: hypothetical protein A2W23_01780 [Planctomycetes bacterium RBG_16_43_13]
MTAYLVWLIICYIYCIVLSVCVRLELKLVYSKLFHYFSFLALLFLEVQAVISMGSILNLGTAIFIVFSFLFMACLLIPYITFLIGFYFDVGKNAILGLDNIKVDKTYDKAEKAEKEKDYDKALEIYQQYLREDPNDWGAKRRIGEIYYIKGDYIVAVNELMKVFPAVENPEAKVVLAFKISDILIEKLDKVERAKEILKQIESEFQYTKWGRYATNRIRMLVAGAAKELTKQI